MRCRPSPNNRESRGSPLEVPGPTCREPSSSHRRKKPSNLASTGNHRRDRLAVRRWEVPEVQSSLKGRCRFEPTHRGKSRARQPTTVTIEQQPRYELYFLPPAQPLPGTV